MFVVFHARDSLNIIAAQRLVSQSVDKEYFFTRTKNNDVELNVVIKSIYINTYQALNGER
jgi:hypothetical protein